jgi:4-carboxymuconolactone decarboxylase
MENVRFEEYSRDQLSPEQQRVFDAISASPRGVVPTPFHILLESPELASLTQALGAFCRYRTGFAPHLSELMVLMTAAYWQADYEFTTHAPEARKAGISDETIAALRARSAPALTDADSQLVHDFTKSFYETRDVPDALFERAVARFGRPRVVELAAILGYYSLLAILLRIFRVPGKTKN